MAPVREVLEYDAWPDATYMGFRQPQIDFVTADQMEAERREERERDQPRQTQRTRTP